MTASRSPSWSTRSRGCHFWFGLIFIKKVTKPNLKKTETVSNRPVLVQFGFFGQKPVWLGFFSWFGFFRFGFDSVQFFWFSAYKTETEPVSFFKILIDLIIFFTIRFFRLFFSGFLGLIGFFGFFCSPLTRPGRILQKKKGLVISYSMWQETLWIQTMY